jgi:hypothetical protein
MLSSHDLPAHPAASNSPEPRPTRPRGRRAAALLTAAAPLTAVALASAPLAVALPAAPPPAAHASAVLPHSGCLAPLAGDQAPKYPACLAD